MFKSVVPLAVEKHKNMRLKPVADYGFAAGQTMCPITAVEFPRVAPIYPIVFLKDDVGDTGAFALLALWAGVVLFPMLIDLSGDYPYADVHAKISVAAAASGLPVLDLVPSFVGHDGHELWITSRDDHPNEEAHAIAARAISAWLVREALSPAGPAARSVGRSTAFADPG